MTRRSYQIKAEQARNERWKTIQIRLTPVEYAAFVRACDRVNDNPSNAARQLVRDVAEANMTDEELHS